MVKLLWWWGSDVVQAVAGNVDGDAAVVCCGCCGHEGRSRKCKWEHWEPRVDARACVGAW